MWLINLEPNDRPANASEALRTLRDLASVGWFSETPVAVAEAIPMAVPIGGGAVTGPLRGSTTQSMARPPTGSVSQRLTANVPKRTTGLQPRRPGVNPPGPGAPGSFSNAPTVVAARKPKTDVEDAGGGVPKWVYPLAGLAVIGLIWGVWPKGKPENPAKSPTKVQSGSTTSTPSAPAPAATLPSRPADFIAPGSILHYRAGEKMEPSVRLESPLSRIPKSNPGETCSLRVERAPWRLLTDKPPTPPPWSLTSPPD